MQELNPAKLALLFRREFTLCAVKPGETIALYGADPERARAAARAFAGNFLFSTGPNTQGGGTRNTKGHYDVPMRDCTVMLDNETVIDRGCFVDARMTVARVAR